MRRAPSARAARRRSTAAGLTPYGRSRIRVFEVASSHEAGAECRKEPGRRRADLDQPGLPFPVPFELDAHLDRGCLRRKTAAQARMTHTRKRARAVEHRVDEGAAL